MTDRVARYLAYWAVVAFLILLAGCGPRLTVVVHDQNAAADVAREYVRLGLVEGNASSAHQLMTPVARKEVPVEELATRMSGAPGYRETHFVEAVLYESRSGKEAIGIYLTCDGPKGAVNYLVVLEGDMESGYQVADLRFLADAPTPSAQQKKF